ncbi:MAG: hypothetical protein ACYS8Y_13540, partial [Planctomycetota bacterium]
NTDYIQNQSVRCDHCYFDPSSGSITAIVSGTFYFPVDYQLIFILIRMHLTDECMSSAEMRQI